jgi:hypothetical protein
MDFMNTFISGGPAGKESRQSLRKQLAENAESSMRKVEEAELMQAGQKSDGIYTDEQAKGSSSPKRAGCVNSVH